MTPFAWATLLLTLLAIVWRGLQPPRPTLAQLLPDLLAAAAVALLLAGAVAATHPPRQSTTVPGPAIALAVDVSASMGCADGDGSRLDLAKRELRTLISGLPNAEFALIPFAGAATVQLPLSNDHEALLFFIDHLTPGMIAAPGSAPEEAVLAAHAALAGTSRPPLVLLLSDGERTLPGRPPKLPNTIPVFAIAIGAPVGASVPERAAAIRSIPEPERLNQLARLSGGQLLTSDSAPAVTLLLERWATPSATGAWTGSWWPAVALLLLTLRQLPLRRRSALLVVALGLLATGACQREEPPPGEATFARAGDLYQRGAKDEAAATFAVAARQLEGEARGAALFNQGTLLLTGGQPRKALPLLEEALLLRPGDETVRTNFILALRACGGNRAPGLGEGEEENGSGTEGAGMDRRQALQLLESVRPEVGGAAVESGRVTELRVEKDW